MDPPERCSVADAALAISLHADEPRRQREAATLPAPEAFVCVLLSPTLHSRAVASVQLMCSGSVGKAGIVRVVLMA
jgi:hypothetical protein